MDDVVADTLNALEHLLAQGEILCEIESGLLDTTLVGLVVTDLRVILVHTSMFRRRSRILCSIPLQELERVDAAERRSPIKKRGVLELVDKAGETYVVEQMPGGHLRAEEIARSILYQQGVLRRQQPKERLERVDTEGTQDDDITPLLPVTIGRGVVSYVNARGGRLYVWGEAFGGGFDYARANTELPTGIEFVRSHAVNEFELYLQRAFTAPRGVRLTRRWWGLRSGIAVDTSLVLDGPAP